SCPSCEREFAPGVLRVKWVAEERAFRRRYGALFLAASLVTMATLLFVLLRDSISRIEHMKLIMVITALTILVIALSVMVLHYFRQTRSEAPTVPPEPPLAFTSDNPTVNPLKQEPF